MTHHVATQPREDARQNVLHGIYLRNLRNRFKAELNHLTSGGMLSQLQQMPEAEQLAFLFSYLSMHYWLREQVAQPYHAELLSAFSRGKQGFLIKLLLDSPTIEQFVQGYIDHWLAAPPEETPRQRIELFQLLQKHHDPATLKKHLLDLWSGINPDRQSDQQAYRSIASEERDRYRSLLGDEDRERLALVDAIPDTGKKPTSYPKLGIIPGMGCPQTCRHCMFIFRPLVKPAAKVDTLLQQVAPLTNSILFTGGDLTRQLGDFYHAIQSMREITTFAILLNGDFAVSPQVTHDTLATMARAIRARPLGWPKANILLQISFDEFHQEVILDRHNTFKERIPVERIANIVEQAPKFSEVLQLCLLHKQNSLNFSTDLFNQGVFARLAGELGTRGHQLEIQSTTPAGRLKRNPLNPGAKSPLIKDATFILKKHPKAPVLLTSSTIDAYGRATRIDHSEAVNERDLLFEVLNGSRSHGEGFDTDLMFWYNGWATLFSAVHICLGNVHEEGMERVLRRLHTDPLCRALQQFDLRLLDYYREIHDDLENLIAQATSPHHLFHTMTEDPAMRLHMTKRLIEAPDNPKAGLPSH